MAILSASVALLSVTGISATNDTTSTTEKPRRELAVVNQAKKPVCDSTERAIAYYRQKVWAYQDELKVSRSPTNHPEKLKNACAYKRWQAQKWQKKARSLYKQVVTYRYHYAWWLWLPDKWQRIGACETGYGKRPGDWKWNSGKFQGAFGFYYGTWDAYKPSGAPSEAYLATPRQQYETALNVYNAHGYGAWGCGGA